MSGGTPKISKRELAIKKAKRKKAIIIVVVSVVALALVVALVISAVTSAMTEVYTDGSTTIELRPSGRFSAKMYHQDTYSGTYAKSADGTSVTFTYSGLSVVGRIEGNTLHLPSEWDDGHGHGTVLPKK